MTIWGVSALSIDYVYAKRNHFEREILEKSLNLVSLGSFYVKCNMKLYIQCLQNILISVHHLQSNASMEQWQGVTFASFCTRVRAYLRPEYLFLSNYS